MTKVSFSKNSYSNNLYVIDSNKNTKFSIVGSTGDAVIAGNLTVNGTTTTINSTTQTIDDVILTLGGDTAPSNNDNKDRGIEFRWHDGTSAKVGFLGFDRSTQKLTFIPDATNSSEVFSGTVGQVDFATATQTALDNSTSLANTAYVQTATRITLNAQTDNYTLAVSDEGKMITMNKATATTVTIPLNSSIAIATGAQIIITRIGAGSVNISPTVGVTLNSISSNRYIANTYGAVTLIKTATDTWYLFGDLSSS